MKLLTTVPSITVNTTGSMSFIPTSEIRAADVVMGRSTEARRQQKIQPGNRNLERIAEESLTEFEKADRKSSFDGLRSQEQINQDILDQVRQSGGRFLKWVKDGIWEEITARKEKVNKIGAVREKVKKEKTKLAKPTKSKQQQQQQQQQQQEQEESVVKVAGTEKQKLPVKQGNDVCEMQEPDEMEADQDTVKDMNVVEASCAHASGDADDYDSGEDRHLRLVGLDVAGTYRNENRELHNSEESDYEQSTKGGNEPNDLSTVNYSALSSALMEDRSMQQDTDANVEMTDSLSQTVVGTYSQSQAMSVTYEADDTVKSSAMSIGGITEFLAQMPASVATSNRIPDTNSLVSFDGISRQSGVTRSAPLTHEGQSLSQLTSAMQTFSITEVPSATNEQAGSFSDNPDQLSLPTEIALQAGGAEQSSMIQDAVGRLVRDEGEFQSEESLGMLSQLAGTSTDNQNEIAIQTGSLNDDVRLDSDLELVMSVMKKYKRNHSVQATASKAVANLVSDNPDNKARLANLGAIGLILSVMNDLSENADIQMNGCGALGNFAKGNAKHRTMIAETGGGIELILRAMHLHSENNFVQEEGCWALYNLMSDADSVMKIMKHGGVELARSNLKKYPSNRNVKAFLSHWLSGLEDDPTCKDEFVNQHEGLFLVLDCMDVYREDFEVQWRGCYSIAVMFATQSVETQAEAFTVLLRAMDSFQNDVSSSKVLEYGCMAMSIMLHECERTTLLDKIDHTKSVQVLLQTVQSQGAVESLQANGFMALVILAKKKKASALEIVARNGVEVILASIKSFEQSEAVQRNAFSLLEELARVSDEAKLLIASANGTMLILVNMGRHSNDSPFQSVGCQILASLARRVNERSDGQHVLEVVVAAMTNFPKVKSIQVSGCKTLAGLCQSWKGVVLSQSDRVVSVALQAMESFGGRNPPSVQRNALDLLSAVSLNNQDIQNDIDRKGGVPLILKAVTQFSSDVLVQTRGLSTLANLASNSPDIRIHITGKQGIPSTIESMRMFPDKEKIQQYGCWLLSFLADTFDDRSQFRVMAIINSGGTEAVYTAMAKYPHNGELQLAACQALLILVTNGNPVVQKATAELNGVDLVISAATRFESLNRIGNSLVESMFQLSSVGI